jgi:hypothetical protein
MKKREKIDYRAKWVPARFGVRCCATGCGDKIKPLDKDVAYLEDLSCAYWFENGHPDYGHPLGNLIWEETNEE